MTEARADAALPRTSVSLEGRPIRVRSVGRVGRDGREAERQANHNSDGKNGERETTNGGPNGDKLGECHLAVFQDVSCIYWLMILRWRGTGENFRTTSAVRVTERGRSCISQTYQERTGQRLCCVEGRRSCSFVIQICPT